MRQNSFEAMLKKWVVNDYFTPNIKAEVILDMLLTPYVPQILRSHRGDIDAVFLAKEMSMIETDETSEGQEQGDNRGPKIDYVLADKNRDCVYFVELKTTDSSIDAKQLSFYISLAGQTSNFGDVLGKRLLAILKKYLKIDLGTPEGWVNDNKLMEAWQKIWDKWKQYVPANQYLEESGSYTKMAMELIKAKGWTSSRKYVYTLGQLMDFIHGEHYGKGLWNRQVEMVYLIPQLPKDRTMFSEKIYPAAFVPYFETEQKNTPLADMISEIYGGI